MNPVKFVFAFLCTLFAKLQKNRKGISPGMVVGIVMAAIVTFIVLMVGIMIVTQTDTAASALISNTATAKDNITYTALLNAVWNAFGLFNVYPIIIAAVGVIAIIGLFAAGRME